MIMRRKEIEFSKEMKKKIIEELRTFFQEEFDQEIGEIKGELILDFISENIGRIYYNEGLKDGEAHIRNALEDFKAMER